MNLIRLTGKVVRGFPFLIKEVRSQVSIRTPFFVAKPRTVHLWRDAPCNARCIMCYFGYRKGQALRDLFKSPLVDEKIPNLIDQIHELGGRGTIVSYMGGEPLLSPSLFDWLERANRLKLSFRFTTNGYNLDQETARRLVAANLFNIGVSIESLDPAINEIIRPYPDGTAKTIAAIELLLEEKRRQNARISVNIKTTLSQPNIESIVDIARRWGRVDGVVITPQMFEAVDDMPEETRNRLWITDIERIEAVVRELKSLRASGCNINADDQTLDDFVRAYRQDPKHKSTMQHRTTSNENRPDCHIGMENLYISNGAVLLCPFFPTLGNVLEDGVNLKKIWNSPAAGKMRSQMVKCRKLCTLSCTRRLPLSLKVRTFLKM